MDAIKKKMQAMKLEKDNAMDKADTLEQQNKEANNRAEKTEEEIRLTQKKMQQVENELDLAQEQLSAANTKLEEKEKALQNAEEEVHNLQKRMQQLENDLDQVQESLLKANTQLEEKDKALSNVSAAARLSPAPPHPTRCEPTLGCKGFRTSEHDFLIPAAGFTLSLHALSAHAIPSFTQRSCFDLHSAQFFHLLLS
ncbi:hypothetical protein Pcinc_028175 [Petrolisthes cinctipes]|uniref:Tropomyosin n=1 Tax=Petrolisthes cinctipes TaxID=88211 RepID=A0AAE1F2D6_PETCI|nr:hypothetical protein Pcinc_028175 [Petrolisthes cinctipes]